MESTETQSPTSERVRLKGHTPLSETTLHGWPALLFGLPFTGAGIAIILVALGHIAMPRQSIHAPMWVIGAAGGLFLGLGSWLTIHGIRSFRRIWNMNEGKRRMPNSPWLWDYPWSARGSSENTLRQVLTSFIALAVFSAFLAPFNWVAFFSKNNSILWQLIVGVLDLIVIIGVGGRCVTRVGRYLKFGNGQVNFHSFPFWLGEIMSLSLKNLPWRQPGLTNLTIVLRCIEEAYESRGKGTDVVCYQVYANSRTVQHSDIQRNGDLQLSWTLPDNKALTSTPSERPARFWELEVVGTAPGFDYNSQYILPVYAKTG